MEATKIQKNKCNGAIKGTTLKAHIHTELNKCTLKNKNKTKREQNKQNQTEKNSQP
jgi:hypothetical protein